MRIRTLAVLGIAALALGGLAASRSIAATESWSVAGIVGQSQTDNSIGHVGVTGAYAGVNVGGPTGATVEQVEFVGHQGAPHLRSTTARVDVAALDAHAAARQATAEPNWSGPSLRQVAVTVGQGSATVSAGQYLDLTSGTCVFRVEVATADPIELPCPAGTEIPEIPQLPYTPPPGL